MSVPIPRARATLLILVLAAGVLPVAAGDASPIREPRWASLEVASIRPGARVFIDGAQCTANFVFYDRRHVYLGTAAHCAGTDGSTATDGCEAGTLPRGTRVQIEGARRQGVLVYSSWVTMQRLGETDRDACAYNDFALIRLWRGDRRAVNPTIPVWGGPTGLGRGSVLGDEVFSYGRSQLWLGIGPLQPHRGVGIGQPGRGWAHKVYTAPPGIPGDSGSGYLDARGRALGVLSTIEIYPYAASNDVADLRMALRYMKAHTGLDAIRLARGTDAFAA